MQNGFSCYLWIINDNLIELNWVGILAGSLSLFFTFIPLLSFSPLIDPPFSAIPMKRSLCKHLFKLRLLSLSFHPLHPPAPPPSLFFFVFTPVSLPLRIWFPLFDPLEGRGLNRGFPLYFHPLPPPTPSTAVPFRTPPLLSFSPSFYSSFASSWFLVTSRHVTRPRPAPHVIDTVQLFRPIQKAINYSDFWLVVLTRHTGCVGV